MYINFLFRTEKMFVNYFYKTRATKSYAYIKYLIKFTTVWKAQAESGYLLNA